MSFASANHIEATTQRHLMCQSVPTTRPSHKSTQTSNMHETQSDPLDLAVILNTDQCSPADLAPHHVTPHLIEENAITPEQLIGMPARMCPPALHYSTYTTASRLPPAGSTAYIHEPQQ